MSVSLIKIHNPLDRRDRDVVVIPHTAGMMLSEIVPAAPGIEFSVSVNGSLVDTCNWQHTSVMPGDQILLVSVLAGGSSQGSKNIVRWVVAVVAVVLAVATAGSSVAAYTAAFAVGSVLSAVGGTIATIMAPSKAPSSASLGYQGFDQSNAYSWNPQTTQQQGIVIPRWYGRNKLNGNIIATNLINSGSQQYLNVLICLGIGPLKNLTDFQINKNEFVNLRGVEVHSRLGTINQTVVPNFNDVKTEYPQGNKVTYGSPVTIATVGSLFDALEIDVTFPAGLFWMNDQGVLANNSVAYRIEIKKQGDANWSNLTNETWQTLASKQNYWTAGYWQGAIGGVSTWFEVTAGSSNKADHYEGEISGPLPYPLIGYARWHWVGPAVVLASGTHDYVTAFASQTQVLRYTYSANNLPPGKYDIRVTNLTPDQTSSRYGDDLYITSIREVVYEDMQHPRLALVGIRALATDQLSGSFSFSCMTDGQMVRIWNGTTWSVDASNNPAWVCWDILTQPVFSEAFSVLEYRGIDPSRLDLVKFLQWADFCDTLVPDGSGGTEKRITFNGGFDAATNLWDACMAVCKLGRASLVWNGIHISVTVDMPGIAVQLFTVGNIGIDSFEETFLSLSDRATEIEIDYINRDKNFERDKLTILDVTSIAKPNKTSLQLTGCSKASEAWRAGMYYLNCNKYLLRICSFTADIDSIACTVGDIINVQHDVPQWGEGGRIVSATSTTVTLDKPVVVEALKTYSLMLRLDDDSVVERVVSNGYGTYSTLTVATPYSATPTGYCPYAFGETSKLIKPFRVLAIEPATDLKRKLICTEYNASIYGSDTDQPVIQTLNVSTLALPIITGITATERLEKMPGGAVRTMVDLSWNAPSSNLIKNIEVLYRALIMVDANFNTSGPLPANTTGLPIEILYEGNYYFFYVRTTGWLGETQDISILAPLKKKILGKVAPPADVTDFYATPVVTGGIRFTWKHISDLDLSEYLIRYSPLTSGASWFGASELLRTAANYANLPVPQTGTYFIKAIDTTGHESVGVDSLVIATVGSSVGLTSHTLITESPSWTGGKYNCYLQSGTLWIANLLGPPPEGVILTDITGRYSVATEIDFGSPKAARVSAKVTWHTVGMGSDFDAVESFDSITGFDGETGQSNVQVIMTTSQTSAAPDFAQPVTAGDYVFQRAVFEIKAFEKLPDQLIIDSCVINIDLHNTVITI